MSYERVKDDSDMASLLESQHTETAINNVRRMNRPQQVQNEDGTWPVPDCVDCEEPIHTARLEHGYIRCTCCQTLIDKRKNR